MKSLFNRCATLFRKYREIIVYLVVGGITTLISWGTFWLFDRPLGLHYMTCQVLSTVIAILAAFPMNRWLVFPDSEKGFRPLLRQFVSFVSMRVLSFLAESLLLALMVETLHWDEMIVKIVVSVVVVILNYVFSKLLIFRKGKGQDS